MRGNGYFSSQEAAHVGRYFIRILPFELIALVQIWARRDVQTVPVAGGAPVGIECREGPCGAVEAPSW